MQYQVPFLGCLIYIEFYLSLLKRIPNMSLRVESITAT